MSVVGKDEFPPGSKEELDEPLKRFTKEDLKKHLKAHHRETHEQARGATTAQTPGAKVSLAAVLESDRKTPLLDQHFPRSFARTPCKPNVDPQPKTKLIAVVVVVVFFVTMGVYLLVKHHLDKSKPHPTPKNMPMRVIEGQQVYQN